MTALIILAAGASVRLGRPKQNLLFNNKTLLQNAIQTGLLAECRPVLVVLGANATAIERWPHHPDVNYIYNADWKQGMASSIVTAITEAKNYPMVNEVVIMVCDQPYVNEELIDELIIKNQETGKAIVASSYNNTEGVPVLFARKMFEKLVQLQGHEGAKKIIRNHPQDLATVPFINGMIDIDTEDDYEALFG